MVDDVDEPCIIVGDETTYVRISTCYHLIGENTLYVTEFVDGDYNSKEEIEGDFDCLTDEEAVEIAKKHSVYLKP